MEAVVGAHDEGDETDVADGTGEVETDDWGMAGFVWGIPQLGLIPHSLLVALTDTVVAAAVADSDRLDESVVV